MGLGAAVPDSQHGGRSQGVGETTCTLHPFNQRKQCCTGQDVQKVSICGTSTSRLTYLNSTFEHSPSKLGPLVAAALIERT